MTRKQKEKIVEAYEIVLKVWIDTGETNNDLDQVLDLLPNSLNEN